MTDRDKTREAHSGLLDMVLRRLAAEIVAERFPGCPVPVPRHVFQQDTTDLEDQSEPLWGTVISFGLNLSKEDMAQLPKE